ncbi:MerR family transcriptional regulator [Actinoplanes sp. G11-F43]|uniref:helix-turn-helix domain-containing protein n=1 Tax=Actinoplanes sp. G11-F43 TaxID=3424130 RepID=UPI003D347D10
MWTMEQLVERVSAALAAEYPGAPNGRVREVPDRRSIRWYTTIGLVDRPLGTRGRTVFYGPRHLLQLVAIKRRQAAGLTLAEIQGELSGVSEETLAEVARVPPDLLGGDTTPADDTVRPQFWKTAPAAPGRTPPPAPDDDHHPPGATRRALEAALDDLSPASTPVPGLITGVPLGSGVILLLPWHVPDIDRDDIVAAARPLLDLLASRGLTDGRDA